MGSPRRVGTPGGSGASPQRHWLIRGQTGPGGCGAVSNQQEVPGPADAQLKMNLGAISQRSLGEGRHHSPGIREFMLSSAVTTWMCLSVCLCHTHSRAGGRNVGDVATHPPPRALPFSELPSPPSPLLASGNRPRQA